MYQKLAYEYTVEGLLARPYQQEMPLSIYQLQCPVEDNVGQT